MLLERWLSLLGVLDRLLLALTLLPAPITYDVFIWFTGWILLAVRDDLIPVAVLLTNSVSPLSRLSVTASFDSCVHNRRLSASLYR